MKIYYILIILFSSLLYSQQKIVKIEGQAQGTTYHISYFDTKNRNLQPEIEQILADFDKSVSTYLPTSIISRINSNEKNVKVDNYFKTCFTKAKEIWKNTNGTFDPTVFPLVNAWGFGPDKKQKIEKNKIDSILEFVGFDLIKLRGNRIIKKDSRVQLDFNAFAQGYSVDVIADFLDSKQIKSYLVEIGGEVYAKGKKANNTKWTVGIEKPINNKKEDEDNPIKAIIKLENLAIATSGDYRKYSIENGMKFSHLIDPKTGHSIKNNLLSVSIFAKDCISSDAYATGIFVLGLEKAKIYLESHPEIQAYLIYSDENGNFQTYETSELKSILIEAE
jgi:FAD:protein FMN transferase